MTVRAVKKIKNSFIDLASLSDTDASTVLKEGDYKNGKNFNVLIARSLSAQTI